MGKSSYREKRLAGQVSLALAAGMFSVVPVAHGMPTLDNVDPRSGNVTFTDTVTETEKNKAIASDALNNVINWKDFSIASDEHVAFDNNNYMNIVTGTATSAIDGKLTGGGDIYLINPNGVIFGSTAQVNVGNLYVSTRQASQVDIETFLGTSAVGESDAGTILNAINTTNALTADVVNLIDNKGYVKADKVVMEGNNIRFLNASSVAAKNATVTGNTADGFVISENPDASKVILRADTDGYIHVGDSANNAAENSYVTNYTPQTMNQESKDSVNYAIVRSASNLASINTDATTLSGHYMLANDIDASLMTAPIGSATRNSATGLATNTTNKPFQGMFDGMFFTISNLNNASKFSGYDNKTFLGLFAYTRGATIENVGVQNVYLPYQSAGGIVGYADSTTLRNVWNAGRTDTKVSVGDGTFFKATGGLVGILNNSTLTNAYNQSYVSGGGLVGGVQGVTNSSKVVISNAYNTGKLVADNTHNLSGICGQFLNSSFGQIENVYTASLYAYGSDYRIGTGASLEKEVIVSTIGSGSINKSYIINLAGTKIYDATVASPHLRDVFNITKIDGSSTTYHSADVLNKSAYSEWGTSISSEGGDNTTWRIYEGASLPLLTSFMKAKGTVSMEYDYKGDNGAASSTVGKSGTYNTTSGTIPLPSKTYDAKGVYNTLSYTADNTNGKYVLDTDGQTYRRATAEELANNQIQKYKENYILTPTYYGMNASAAEVGATQNDRKDVYVGLGTTATKFALFYGGQQGYDLYGNNFTINKRNIKIGVNNNAVSKVYDGQSRNTVSGAGLLGSIVNADDTSKPGVISGDAVTIGGKVTYVYNNDDGQGNLTEDKNFGAKKVTITTDGLTLTGASKDNYNANFTAPTQPVSANITKRTIQVGLYNTSGITKTYDGTATVTNENKGDRTHGFVGKENVDTSTLTNVDGDAVWLENQFDTNGNPLTITIAGMLSADGVGFNIEGVTSRYVQSDRATNAVNVADVYKVAYEGIALTADSESALANYQLSNNGAVYADGGITKRNILSSSLGYDSSGSSAITKVYDGSETMSGGAVQDVTVGNQVAKGTTSTRTGLINTDANAVQFATTGTATFYLSGGMTPTANATDYKGTGTGAQIVKYNVALKATNATTANYTVDGNDLDTTTIYGVEGTGTITKRGITVELVKNSDIDKTYNGTADLDAGTAANYKNGSISISGGATGNLRYAQDSETIATTDTGVNISITNAAYADQNVAYDGSGNVTDKNITYTVAFNNVDAAYNYTLNTVASTTAPASTTLAATGTIAPRELSLTFGSADKTYDGDALVDAVPTVTAENLATGDTQADVLNTAKIAGRYGSDATGTFVENANVGSYTTDANTAGNKVLYTGLADGNGGYTDIKTAIKSKNYTISSTIYGKGIISKKTIGTTDLDTATEVKSGYTLFTKVYDGSETDSSAAVTGKSWSEYLKWKDDQTVFAPTDRDNLTITIAEAIYANKNSGDSATQNVSLVFDIKGDAAANYEFEGATVTSNPDGSQTIAYTKSGYTGTITPRTVTVTMKDGVTSPTKIYDGTTTVKATGVTTTAGVSTLDNGTWSNWFQMENVVDGEDLQLANGITAAYASENVAYDNVGGVTTQAVNYGNVALANGTSALASNYTLVNNIQGIGTINKRNVTLSDYGVAAATKTYDGDADVEAYALTFAEATQEGATDKSVLFADGITTAEGVISSGLTGTYLKTGTESEGKDVLRDANDRSNILAKNVEYTGTALTNLYGGNYNVTLANGGTYDSTTGKLTVTGGGKINPAQIVLNDTEIHATAADKIYDGKTTLENAASSYLTFDSDDVNAHLDELTIAGVYDEKNAGNREVTYTISMDANNYDLSGTYYNDSTGTVTKTGSGTISKKTIYGVVDATEAVQKSTISKVYDGYTTVEDADATAAKTWLTTNLSNDGSGAVAITDEDGNLDDVSIVTTGVTLAYKDANVATSGDNNKVTYSGLALTGTDAENYTLGNATVDEKKVAYGYGTITPKSIAFDISVADGAYTKDYDGETGLDGKLDGVDTTNSATLTGTVTSWWSGANGVRAAGDTTEFGNAFETDDSGNLVGYYGVWNPTTKTFTENSNVWADKANNKKTSDVYYGLTLKGDAAQNYVLASTGGTTGATINVNNTTIQDTVYFQDAMQGKGEILPLAISMEKVKNKWGTFEKVYDGSTSVEGYLVSGAETPTKEQQLTIYFDRDGSGDYSAGDVIIPYSVDAANYEDANAGAKNVWYTGFSFNDSDLDNFIIPAADLREKYADGKAATKTTGNIARRLLNVTPGTNNVKIYDGNAVLVAAETPYTVAERANLNDPTGRIVGDDVSVTYAANFADANASVDPDADASDAGWTAKNVTYTYTLSGAAKGNYTLDKDARLSTDSATAEERTFTTVDGTAEGDPIKGGIKRREVLVSFAEGKSTGLDKTYDKTATVLPGDGTSLLTSGDTAQQILAIAVADDTTGIIDNGVHLDYDSVTANYEDANVAFNNGTVTTKKVYFQNMNIVNGDGSANTNYVVKTANVADRTTLEGTGTVARRKIDVDTMAAPTKVYDTTDKIELPNGTLYENSAQRLAADDAYITIKTADGATDGLATGDTLADVQVTVESAIYHDKNAGNGLGVTYKLKWDNKNYELVQCDLVNGEEVKTFTKDGYGNITPKTITVTGTPTITKTYDGTTDVTDASGLASDLFTVGTTDSDNGVYAQDMATLLKNVSGTYASADTGATADSASGTPQNVTVSYELNKNSNNAYNYKIDGNETSVTNKLYENGGVINRAQVTLTPTEVSYYPDQAAGATYTGTYSGFVDGEGLADGDVLTFGRNENTSTAVGNYTLLGYVNGNAVPVNGMVYYNNLSGGTTGNYYFTTRPNTALHIVANPQNADASMAADEAVIADKKFTPDDYSYNRISQDEDLTRLNRESQASVQYAEKGVNIDGDDDAKSGLASMADVQGSGSVVNLDGAVIRTSAVQEAPEEVAAEAAIPVPAAEESDVSSIDLEYADEKSGSQSMLEILTNASNNAENKGTSIVIHTMDEDEEEDAAETEKSRRALLADRSNIGIETLGDAVNLDQMIG